MNAISTFDFEGSAVRIQDRDGEPWFVGKDVCGCLEIGNHRDALARLDTDERDDVGIPDAIGREQATIVVNEPGVFQLVFTSRTDAAKRFKRWLAHEVLPSIRRTGGYTAPRARTDEVDPDVERLWMNKVNLALRVYGRQAARDIWEMSPMHLPSADGRRMSGTVEEGYQCLQHLLSFRPVEEESIGELIAASKVSEKASNQLAVMGVRVDFPAYPDALVVADIHPVVMAAFGGTPWEKGWRRALLAIPGAQGTETQRYRRIQSTGVAIPMQVSEKLG